jgi:hypothetical protein
MQIRVFDRDSIRSAAESKPITRTKESSTQQQYAIWTFSVFSETEKIETARQKAMGKKKGGGANNDDQNAELKQATLAGRRAHRFPP